MTIVYVKWKFSLNSIIGFHFTYLTNAVDIIVWEVTGHFVMGVMSRVCLMINKHCSGQLIPVMSLTIWMFVQKMSQANNKDITKFWITGSLCRGSTGDTCHQWIPCTKGQQCRKCFHVTSSCKKLCSQFMVCCVLVLVSFNIVLPRTIEMSLMMTTTVAS